MPSILPILPAATLLTCIGSPLYAYDLSPALSIGGVLAGAGQCQELSAGAGERDACRGALPFQPHISFRPTDRDELFAKLGLAAGNNLNPVSPFELATWAADLEEDAKDINGRGRNYLLTAWYRHAFRIEEGNTLSATLGLIDATEYLDSNSFANDEYTQFMNDALTNSPKVILPSYDLGTALQWDLGSWSLRAVYMNVGKDEDEEGAAGGATAPDIGDDYDYVGVEIDYSIRTALGEGNYRVLYARTSRDFLDPTATSVERRAEIGLSFDQELGHSLGVFLRVNTKSDDAAIEYDSLFSGGIDIQGNLWGRERDNIGLGVAYLSGGNRDIERTRVAEGYYRFVVGDRFALTADLQFMRDDRTYRDDPKGIIFGLRATADF
jgi:porin